MNWLWALKACDAVRQSRAQHCDQESSKGSSIGKLLASQAAEYEGQRNASIPMATEMAGMALKHALPLLIRRL